MFLFYMAMIDEPDDRVMFEQAYNRYCKKMIALAYGIIGNYHDAEEAVSSAFLRIAENFEKLKKRSGQERAAYYCVITKNCAYDILRSQNRRKEIPIDEDTEIPDGESDVSDEVLNEFGYQRVIEAIRSLPEKYAQALYLQNVTGLSVKEISDDLGITEEAVRKRLERARIKLRAILEEQGIAV
ncbi:MAG: RNA polymerase sigma factor [Ruminiclostridium sp.]|nr:RNA polymerase sigma factor [Ruminiclostridium sp.]